MKICLLALCLLVAAGCSTFNKEWKATANSCPGENLINGRWQGEWRSDQNGHHGSLRCVVTQTSPTTYRAHFRARYMKILRFTYIATLTGHSTSNTFTNNVILEGTSDLGKLAGGIYTYNGVANATNFTSTYSCKYDHGNYAMKRP